MPRIKLQRAMEQALAARCAYPELREQVDELGLDTWQPFEAGRTEGIIGSTGKKVLLSFRGVGSSQDKYDILTWMEKAFGELGAEKAGMRQFHSGQVQAYYLEAVQSAWPALSQLLQSHGARDKKLFISGHSQGGAIAMIVGAMCHWSHDLPVESVFTFGAPKACDLAFAENFPIPLYRFENRNDLIPNLPPSGRTSSFLRVLSADIEEAFERWFGPDFLSWKLRGAGELRYIDRRGKILDAIHEEDRLVSLVTAMVRDPAQLLQDHWIDSYCAAIESRL